MDIMSAFPSNYLKADDLQGREVQVVMDRVDMEDVGGDHKPVLYFQGKDKGVVLNKTNSTNITMVYGSNTEGWRGKTVTLYSTWVDFQGKSVQSIRIRGPQNVAHTGIIAQAPMNSDPFAGVKVPEEPAKTDLPGDDIPF